MRIRTNVVRALAALLLACAWVGHLRAAQTDTATGWAIAVAPDREDGVYAPDEPIVFRIAVTHDDRAVTQGIVEYELLLNDMVPADKGRTQLGQSGATVTSRLANPGCLVLKVTYAPDESGAVKAETGAVVDPFAIRPSLPTPDDFDKFWAEQRARLAASPMKPRLTPVDDPRPDISWGPPVECFDVQIDCPGGAPVSAYFVRPKDAAPGSLPARISFHGAGVRSSNLQGAWNQAKTNALGMDLNAHGLPNGKPKEYYEELRLGALRDYGVKGIESRDTYYFLGMYLRLMRALDFLCEQPEWDGRNLIVTGGSQGGAQALVAAGLDERVTLISAGLPALCDLTAAVAERKPGWPLFTRPPLGIEYRDTVRYFDVCNFTPRTNAAAVARVGLIDHVCPPATVLAAYNGLKGEKYAVIDPASGHQFTASETRARAEAKFQQLLARQLEEDSGTWAGEARP